MRSFNRQGSTHKDGLRIGLKVGQPVENGGVVEYFFGSDGNEPLHCDKFSKFLKELHDEVICFFHTLIQHDDLSTKNNPWLDMEEKCIYVLFKHLFRSIDRHMSACKMVDFFFLIASVIANLDFIPFK